MQRKEFHGVLSSIKNLLFPPFCTVCCKPVAGVICGNCLENITFIRSPRCPGCGRGMSSSAPGDHLCASCLRTPPLFSTVFAVALYQKPLSTLVHRLKYQGDMAVLPALRIIVEQHPPARLTGNEILIPVPLHTKRLRQRGFNQSALLVDVLFPGNKSLLRVDFLQRHRHTDPQTGLDGRARRKNLKGAFAVRNGVLCSGKRVVLVDDVYTTGSTVAECSRVLLRAGASEVHVVTLARVKE